MTDARDDGLKERANLTIVLQSVGLPENNMLLDGIDTSEGPLFSVTEAAKAFFGRSGHWIRWKEREGDIVLDGKPVARGRSKGARGYRCYTLNDIEQMAHALAQCGAIDGSQLLNALRVVQAMARIYEYLPPEWDPEDGG